MKSNKYLYRIYFLLNKINLKNKTYLFELVEVDKYQVDVFELVRVNIHFVDVKLLCTLV